MAKLTKEYININRLYGNASGGSPKAATSVYSGQVNGTFKKHYRVYNGNTVVWDVWETELEVGEEFNIPASGGTTSNLIPVSSTYTNADNYTDNLAITCIPATIDPNKTSTAKTHTITVTQEYTNLSLTTKLTQAANEQTITYGTPTFNFIEYMSNNVVAADGAGVILMANITQNRIITNSWGGTPEIKTITQAVPVSSITGSTISNLGTVSGGEITAPSRTNVTGSIRDVYKITGVTYTGIDGKSYSKTGLNQTIQQEANIKVVGTSTVSLSATVNETQYSAAAVSVPVNVNATKTTAYSYTSGYNDGNNNKETVDTSWTASCTGNGSIDGAKDGIYTGTGKGTMRCDLKSNTSTSATKTTTINISSGNENKVITLTQKKDELSGSNTSNITINSVNAMQVPASGGDAACSMQLKVITTPLYVSGSSGTSSTSYTSATITSVTGSAINNSGAYVKADGKTIYVPSLGTTETIQARNVFKITKIVGSLNNKSYTWTGEIYVDQAPNNVTTTWGSYNITIGHSPTGTLSNVGGNLTINVTATQSGTKKYDSGAPDSTTSRNATATVTTTTGQFTDTSSTSTSVTGSGSKTLRVYENTGAQRTITVTASISNTSKSTTITQEAVKYVFESDVISPILVAYSETSITITGTSTRNGYAENIKKGDVSTNNCSIGTITNTENGYFTIPVTFSTNDSSSEITRSITITQPLSGNTITITIKQAVKPAPKDYISWREGIITTGGTSVFSGKLLYDNSIQGQTVYVEAIKGPLSSNPIATRNITLDGVQWNNSTTYNYVDVSISVKTSIDTSEFYLRATYGSDVASTMLMSSPDAPLDPLAISQTQ